ncbi:16131_t:CDS:1, partial [Dentiscutata erythropus]
PPITVGILSSHQQVEENIRNVNRRKGYSKVRRYKEVVEEG